MGATGISVEGNRIGTGADGTSPPPNHQGIFVFTTHDDTIGGTEPGAAT